MNYFILNLTNAVVPETLDTWKLQFPVCKVAGLCSCFYEYVDIKHFQACSVTVMIFSHTHNPHL